MRLTALHLLLFVVLVVATALAAAGKIAPWWAFAALGLWVTPAAGLFVCLLFTTVTLPSDPTDQD